MVAARADAATVSAAVAIRYLPTAAPASVSEDSGVAGRDVCVLNGGRRSEVSDGDGGRGVGGRL